MAVPNTSDRNKEAAPREAAAQEPAPGEGSGVSGAQPVKEAPAVPLGEIDQLKALVVEQEHLLKRVQAEFENSIKRTAREIERAEQAAEARIVIRILPLIDTIEAGLAAEADGSEAHRTLTMVHRAIEAVLTSLNVTRIETIGARFDPHVHEALMTREGADDMVLDVIQHGYRRAERILRHAKVIVGRVPHEP